MLIGFRVERKYLNQFASELGVSGVLKVSNGPVSCFFAVSTSGWASSTRFSSKKRFRVAGSTRFFRKTKRQPSFQEKKIKLWRFNSICGKTTRASSIRISRNKIELRRLNSTFEKTRSTWAGQTRISENPKIQVNLQLNLKYWQVVNLSFLIYFLCFEYPTSARAWSRSLVFFWCAGLRSAAKTVVSWFAKGALPAEYLSHNFDEHCLEDTRLIWCLSHPSGEEPLIPGRYVSW